MMQRARGLFFGMPVQDQSTRADHEMQPYDLNFQHLPWKNTDDVVSKVSHNRNMIFVQRTIYICGMSIYRKRAIKEWDI
jgi:hypothetical protein